jgi:single-strand DNA-binding protein
MINKVILVGRLGRDPEMRFTGTGKPVTTFSVATDGWGKDAPPDWHRVVCWERLAETTNQYLEKGRLVYVEGRITTRKYTDRDGNDRQSTEIVASHVKFLGGGGGGERAPERAPNPPDDEPPDNIPF